MDLRPKLREFLRDAKPGARLPSAHELARRWKASRFSLNRAVAQLIVEGAIERQGYKLFPCNPVAPSRVASEAPFRLYIVAMVGFQEKWFRRNLESRNCAADYNFYSDPMEAWPLFERTLHAHCEGAYLSLEETVRPPHAGRLLDKLLERNIPVVYEHLPGRCCQVMGYSLASTRRAAVRQLADAGHQRVIVPLFSAESMAPVLVWSPRGASAFEEFGIEGVGKLMGRAPTARQYLRFLSESLAGRNRATALLCIEPEMAAGFCDAARKLGIGVPGDLSIVCTGESLSLTRQSTPASAWWLNPERECSLAVDLLVGQIRQMRATGKLPPPEVLRVEPTFFDRGTISQAPNTPSARQPAPREESGTDAPWHTDLPTRRRQVAEINHEPYPKASKARNEDWEPLDLHAVFNRQFAHEHGWVSDLPLLHMPRGRRVIHGVPFMIAGGAFSEKCDCLVLRSAHAHTGSKHPLPGEVTVKVGCRARAVYILHGCGWSQKPGPFASYEFRLAGGTAHRKLVVSYGTNTSGKDVIGGRSANIQDWWPWPNRPQFRSAHARRYVVTDGGDPLLYERYLYTLEWLNPHPDRPVESVVIRSDPKADATLGVLAITAQIAPPLEPINH